MTRRIHVILAVAFGLGLIFFSTSMACAQEGEAKEQAAKKVEALAKQLNLTADQKEKLLPVLADEAPKLKAVKEDTALTGLQKLQKIRAIHAETDPKVKAILTPTQYEQWQTIRQQEIHDMIEKKKAQ